MKCIVCLMDNKEGVKNCRKCGTALDVEPLWQPSWKWHLRTLAVIYVVLTISYFAISNFLSRVPEPYRMRKIPADITPWIKK